ncbi:ABCB family ABC transporter ATP-binding protein/permease [Entomobacter blattae]|uniref:ATM1-type heavy metal exporter n=1 Tax=Entomobacter blattae TaxID=2762277 RepID=A0A7H1NSU5_9PROT|nr:ABC transporter ATP-binding protein/permease [Entomobacter blattae]QNT78855.1 ATM1-type heavy metal exporter [Entomobacter blattae]
MLRNSKKTAFKTQPLKPVTAWSTLWDLVPYLWPKDDFSMRLRVVLACLLMIAAKVATIYVPFVYSYIIDILAHDRTYQETLLVGLTGVIIGYALLRMISSAFAELRDALFAPVRFRISRKAALKSFIHLHKLSLRFHYNRQSGGVSRIIERGTEAIETILRLGVFNIFPTLIEALIVMGVIWQLFNWRYAMVIVIAVSAYIVFTFSFTAWRIAIRRKMNQINTEASGKAVDSLLNYETVKYFGNEEHEATRYDEAQARYEQAAIRTQYSLSGLNLGQASIIALALMATMLMAGQEVREGRFTIGKFVLINTYLLQLYMPLNFLGSVYSSIRQSFVDLEQLFSLLGEHAEIEDQAGAKTLLAHLGEAPAAAIEFKSVWFGYQPERMILKGISFSVPPGARVAIVGPTGAGKSTISRLLFRFYDVNQGVITIDGEDIRHYKQASLRETIGVVPQDTVLFNETIQYNIRYGRLTASQEEVEGAAKFAHIHNFIMRMPDQYNTMVGERGLKLSGGEKQRVAIARAILKNPRILILDEATSALDTRTEKDIQQALDEIAEHRTTIIIAHRLSTIVNANLILTLQDGQIIEQGTHTELLHKNGVYAAMWAAQIKEQDHS